MVRESGGSSTAPYNTWATATNDIQTAITFAGDNAIAEVWITGGTFAIPATLSLRNNVAIYGGFHIGDAARGNRDWAGNTTIISGSGTRRIIFHNDGDGIDASAVVDGVTLQQGYTNIYPGGGAVYLYNNSPTFINCTFTGNSTSRDGGAVAIRAVNSSTFTSCIFSLNTATDDGGAIYFWENVNTSPTFTDCTFNNNQSTDNGGAIYFGNGSPAFTNCTVSNNTAARGGGIDVISGNPSFTACTINTNTANNEGGGGIWVNGGTPTFHRCNIFDNNASANHGGGFYLAGGTTQIKTSIIRTNTANSGRGGGIFTNTANGGNYNILNNTIYGNSADMGGGLSTNSNDDIRFRNTIFYANTATTSGNQVYLQNAGCDPYFDYCVVQGGITAFAGAGQASYPPNATVYTNNLADATDPQFINAAANDFHLTIPGSSCANAGAPPPTTTGLSFPSNEDMDGNQRVRGTVDIGAYETNTAMSIVTAGGADLPGPVAVAMDEDGNPTAFSLTLHVLDPDDEDITWSISSPPSHGAASPASTTSTNTDTPQAMVINYTPTANYNGADAFTVQVTDGDGAFIDNIIVNVTITAINDAPEFTNPAATPHAVSIKAGKLWTFNITATEPESENINLAIFGANPLTPQITFTDNTGGSGTLTGTPINGQVGGPYNLTIRATDDNATPASSDMLFQITVTDNILDVPLEYPTIQAAIDIAEDGVDEIRIAPGTYNENINLNGKDVDIYGDGAAAAITINGGGNDAVIRMENCVGTPNIHHLTITNGSGRFGLPGAVSEHTPANAYYGGGIFLYNSGVIINNVIISNNTLQENSNNGGSGAGIYIANCDGVTIQNTTIENNTSNTYRGGGICIDNSQNINIGTAGNPVTIQNNTAGNYGGGIGIYDSRTNINLEDVTIQNNHADGLNGRGGGSYYHSSTVNQTNVTNNTNTATTGAEADTSTRP